MPAIIAAGLSPIVPVVVMDERDPSNVAVGAEVSAGGPIAVGAVLFTAGK